MSVRQLTQHARPLQIWWQLITLHAWPPPTPPDCVQKCSNSSFLGHGSVTSHGWVVLDPRVCCSIVAVPSTQVPHPGPLPSPCTHTPGGRGGVRGECGHRCWKAFSSTHAGSRHTSRHTLYRWHCLGHCSLSAWPSTAFSAKCGVFIN